MNRRWRLWLGGLAVMGLALLAGNIFLAGQLRLRYERQLMQQVWPAGANRPLVTTGPLEGTNIVLLFGDSRMAEWGGIAVSNQTVVNAGQSGATTGQLRLVLPVLLDEFHPATVVVEAGVNDLKLIGLKPELEDALVAQAEENFSNMVEQCCARGCRVVLLETWPVGKPEWLRRPVWNVEIAKAVARLNERLRLLDSPARKVKVANLFKEAGVAVDAGMFRDALHFKRSVYERLEPALQKQLNETTK
jgi:lysophospholipase L1-like esterase